MGAQRSAGDWHLACTRATEDPAFSQPAASGMWCGLPLPLRPSTPGCHVCAVMDAALQDRLLN